MKSKSVFSSKPVLILLSVIVAFGLWLYVITVVSPNSETTIYDVPVDLQGKGVLNDRKLIITSQTTTVDLRLSGNRSDLNKLSNIRVTVDVTKIYDPGTHELTYTFIPPGNIPSDALTVESKNPNTVRLVVERKSEKEIPVNVQYTGSIAQATEGEYVKEPAELDRTTVVISGPESVVDTITQAVVVIDLNDQKETIVQTETFTLCDEEGNEVKNDLVSPVNGGYEVNVTVPVALHKEVPLRLEVLAGGGATEENVTPSHTSIRISGPEAIVSAVEEILVGTVDLSKVREPGTLEFEIKLPEGVTNETGITTVTAEIVFPGLSTKSFQVNNIEYINLPDGMDVQLSAEVVEVVLRGGVGQLLRMTEEDITVVVDLTGATQGTEKYTATIKINDQFSEVGAIGTYTVTATVSEKDA